MEKRERECVISIEAPSKLGFREAGPGKAGPGRAGLGQGLAYWGLWKRRGEEKKHGPSDKRVRRDPRWWNAVDGVVGWLDGWLELNWMMDDD